MASRPKREGKGWSIRASWYDATGKRQQKFKSGFAKAKDAKEWAETYEEQNRKAPENSHKLTTETFLNDWLTIRENSGTVKPNTLRNDRSDLNKLIPLIGNIPLQNLRLDQIQSAINSLKLRNGEPLSPRSKEMVKLAIKKALKYAVDANIIKDNPADKLTSPKKEESNFYVLSPEEALAQLNKLRETQSILYVPFALAIFMGLRRGEALGLEWQNVDLINGQAHIVSQFTVEDGVEVYKPTLKTKGSKQTIPIPDILLDILKERRMQNRFEKFVCAVNGELPNVSHFNRLFNNFQKANGFRPCRFHDLRHTFATLQLQAGVDIRTISEMLRHKTTHLAMKTYLHPDGTMKKEASAKLNNVFTLHEKKACK